MKEEIIKALNEKKIKTKKGEVIIDGKKVVARDLNFYVGEELVLSENDYYYQSAKPGGPYFPKKEKKDHTTEKFKFKRFRYIVVSMDVRGAVKKVNLEEYVKEHPLSNNFRKDIDDYFDLHHWKNLEMDFMLQRKEDSIEDWLDYEKNWMA